MLDSLKLVEVAKANKSQEKEQHQAQEKATCGNREKEQYS
jgi:hypothetical protein